MNYMMETMMKNISVPLEYITKTHYHSKSVFLKMLQNCIYSNFTYNPFELGELTRIDDISIRFDPRIIADSKLLESNREQQFSMFWNDRLIYSETTVSDTITKIFLLDG